MRRRGKAIAITAVALGLAVLVCAGFAAKDRIREEWWIYKLQTGDEHAKKMAAERLGTLGSVRAIPVLVKVLKASKQGPDIQIAWEIETDARSGKTVIKPASPGLHGPDLLAVPLPSDCAEVLHALWRISITAGSRSVPSLLDALGAGDGGTRMSPGVRIRMFDGVRGRGIARC